MAKPDWNDATLPIGNGPRLPWWPVAGFGAAWLAWIVLLAVMVASR